MRAIASLVAVGIVLVSMTAVAQTDLTEIRRTYEVPPAWNDLGIMTFLQEDDPTCTTADCKLNAGGVSFARSAFPPADAQAADRVDVRWFASRSTEPFMSRSSDTPPMRALPALLVTIAILLAGCLGATDPSSTADPGDAADEASETITEELRFSADVQASVHTTETVQDYGWSYAAPAGVQEIDLELSWDEPANGFGLEVDAPKDTQRQDPPEDPAATSLSMSVDDPTEGSFGFKLVRPPGADAPDSVQLEATVVRLEGPGGASGSLEVRQEGDHWVAEMIYGASGPAGDEMTAEVSVANGDVRAETAGDQAEVNVTAWARAETRDEAVERVREIDVTATVEGDRIVGKARVDDGQWDDRGAHADVRTPARLSGSLATSNGPIDLVGLDGGQLTAETSNGAVDATGTFHGTLSLGTSNGPVTGEVAVHDDLDVGTSNGPIDLDVTPEASLTLDATSSNGGIDLGLTETSEIAYEIQAQTSNGQITEEMDEAHLEGGDESATLRTEDGDGRPIQVTGNVGTSNDDVHFEGL